MFDPQYYTCLVAGADQSRLGNLPEDYDTYFAARRRLDLSRETLIRDDIRKVLEFQVGLPVTHLVAPNILISRSIDSRETATALDFLANLDDCVAALGDERPVLATLAISRDALLDRTQLNEFLTEVTGLGTRVSGFYILISASSSEPRNEIFHSDVVAGWMFVNHVLKVNGFSVVNGYSDLLTPFLCVAGADAGATGWWSNLRTFSLSRFTPGPSGGRLPVPRYLSLSLLNRVTFAELDILRTMFPAVLNGLPTDALYPAGDGGSEPQRNQEVFQTWESLGELIGQIGEGDVTDRIGNGRRLVQGASNLYRNIAPRISLDPKSNGEHLPALDEGLRLFAELAELGASLE